jgi:hypothetical protein
LCQCEAITASAYMRVVLEPTGGCMPTLRTLTIGMAVAGVLAALPTVDARACDNDRYPCPMVSQPQETAAPVRPSAQSRKKASRAARLGEKTRAKPATAVGQEQAAKSGPQKAADPVPAVALNEVDRNESPVAAAAAAWLVLPNTGDTGAQAAAGDAILAASANNEVKVVDANEVNELDLAAAPALPDESSWLSYLVMTLGGALAAASAVRFLFV